MTLNWFQKAYMFKWFKSLPLYLVLPGCVCYKEITYVHEPTHQVITNQMLGDPATTPFMYDGVLIAPQLMTIEPNTRFWLFLLADQPKNIQLQTWRISSAEESEDMLRSGEINQVVAVGTPSYKTDAFTANVVLEQVPIATTDSLFANGEGPCRLTITLGSAEDSVEMAFDISRHVETKVGMLK